MYVKPENRWYKHLDFYILDLLSVQISFVISYCIRHGWHINPYANNKYLLANIVICVSLIATGMAFSIYSKILKRGKLKELIAIVKHIACTGAVSLTILFAAKTIGEYSRISFLTMPVIYIFISYILHYFRKAYLAKHEGSHTRSFLIVADADKMNEVEENVLRSKSSGFRIHKKVTMEDILSGEAVADALTTDWIDEALIVSDIRNEKRNAYVEQLVNMGITVHDALTVDHARKHAPFYEEVASYPSLTTTVADVTTLQAVLKRGLDLVGGFVGSIFCILLLLVIGPIIYIKDPGPIIFKQIRVGKNGKKFKFYKIRSMYKNAEARKKELMAMNKIQDGMMFKMDNDPRILPGIGNFIRESSLDEFPQFFNVLKGDMSLVGTRPPTVDEWEKYQAHHRIRLAVKPGITGMWQVSGRSNITDFEEVIKLDSEYIYNWSPSLDIKILLKTVVQMIKKDGAE